MGLATMRAAVLTPGLSAQADGEATGVEHKIHHLYLQVGRQP